MDKYENNYGKKVLKMGVKAIIKNIKTVGVKETYNISKKRKQERITDHKVAEELRKMLAELAEKEESEEKKELMLKGVNAKRDKEVREVLRQMDKLNYGVYRKEMKSRYVKKILPDIYNDFKKYHVENVAVFMQPRTGVNQSCKYIYNKLKKDGEYQVILREMHRGELGTSEYYANAEKLAREIGTAKVVFVHESNSLLGYLKIRKETKVVQLWHGCGVFKKLGLSTIGNKNFKSKEAHDEYPEYNNYSIVTIASPELSWVFEEFMGIRKEEGIIQPIGVSRTDEFFDKDYLENCYKTLYNIIPMAKDKKVILYAPTYRGKGLKRETPNELDVKMFAEELGDEYILIFKHHQTVSELPEIPEPYRNTFAYDMTRGKGMSINDLMAVADICISDYSSVVFEYSLFERPMLFYVYDLEEYIDNRGLYYDFEEITPGPLCKTNEDMIDYIKNVNERFDKQEVTDFKNKFMCCCDGHATERILEFIKK